MYLISRSANLTMPLRDTKTEYNKLTGHVERVHPALSVQFHHAAGAPDWAKDAVQALPGWGNGIGLDEDPFSRVGILDTDEESKRQNWTPDEKEFVEAALRNAPANGVEYVICAAPRTPKPWNTYDEDFVGDDAVAKILYTVELTGADPRGVLRYERENAAREDVISALETLLEKERDDVVGVISA